MLPVLTFRLPWRTWRALRRTRIALTDTSTIGGRAWPQDLDLFGHVNNGRFVTLLDLGRMDHLARSGLFRVFRAAGLQPVAGSVSIRFRRELRLFRRYQLHTRMVGVDGRWGVFSQRMEDPAGQLLAEAWVKVAVLRNGTLVDMDELLDLYGNTAALPPLPDDIQAWTQLPVG